MTIPNNAASGPPLDVEETLAQIEKGQQLAGHFPNQDALDRARKVLTGELTEQQALQEIRMKYGLE